MIPTKLAITENTYNKGLTLCKVVEEVSGFANEWGGVLLAHADEALVRDIYIPPSVDASAGHVRINKEIVDVATREVVARSKSEGRDWRVVGWTHGHGNFGSTHSAQDHETQEMLVRSVWLNTRSVAQNGFNLFEDPYKVRRLDDDKIIVDNDTPTDARVIYQIDHDVLDRALRSRGWALSQDQALDFLVEALQGSKVEVSQPVSQGFFASVVWNNQGDTYAEIGSFTREAFTGKEEYNSNRVPLEVVRVPDDIPFDRDEIVRVVKECMKFSDPDRDDKRRVKLRYTGFGSNLVPTYPSVPIVGTYESIIVSPKGFVVRSCFEEQEGKLDEIIDRNSTSSIEDRERADLENLIDSFVDVAARYVRETKRSSLTWTGYVERLLAQTNLDLGLDTVLRVLGVPQTDGVLSSPNTISNHQVRAAKEDLKLAYREKDITNFERHFMEFFVADPDVAMGFLKGNLHHD